MKNIFLIFLIIIPYLPLSAQTTDETDKFTPSSSQKGVAVSTDVLTLAMPVATLAGVLIMHDWKGLVQGCYTAAATAGATLILKYSIKEERPDHSNFHSFPSGHTSTSFATAAFLQRRYGWKFGAPAYAIATYVGFGRIYSKKHHWWDVVAGAAIGAGSAYIFTRSWAQQHNLQISTGTLSEPVTHTPIPTISASFDF